MLERSDGIDWTSLIGSTAVFSTVLQFLTGCLICHKYIQKKSTGDSSGFPFVSGFLACALWLVYGKLTDDYSVTLVNTIGCVLFLFYIVVYYVFTVNKITLLKQCLAAFIILFCHLAYVEYVDNVNDTIEFTGLLCCFITVVFFAAPMTMVFHVMRVKNAESLPFPLIASTFIVSFQWLVYGLLKEDLFIQIPNFLGCVLSGGQLLLFLIYPSKLVYGGISYKALDQSAMY